jgi:hypothetical protein
VLELQIPDLEPAGHWSDALPGSKIIQVCGSAKDLADAVNQRLPLEPDAHRIKALTKHKSVVVLWSKLIDMTMNENGRW